MKLKSTLLSALTAMGLMATSAHAQQDNQHKQDKEHNQNTQNNQQSWNSDSAMGDKQAGVGMQVAIRPQALAPSMRKDVQRKLKKAGHYKGAINGRFNRKTTAGLQAYQQSQQLDPTGKLDVASLRALGVNVFDESRPVAGTAPPMGNEQANNRQMNQMNQMRARDRDQMMTQSRSIVRQVQTELRQRNMYQGQIDGRAGPRTRAALRQFQQEESLKANGEMTEDTLDALGVDKSATKRSRHNMTDEAPDTESDYSDDNTESDYSDETQR